MGLLSHMEALHAAGFRQCSGSTACSAFSSPENTSVFDFHKFAEEAELKQCALLVPFGRRFLMRYAHGIDADTIWRATSSFDFWNGTLPSTNEWCSFSGEGLEPFYQLFSEKISHTLDVLHIKTFRVLADVSIKIILMTIDSTFSKNIPDSCIHKLTEYVAADSSNFATYRFYNSGEKEQMPVTGNIFHINLTQAIDTAMAQADYEAQNLLSPVLYSEAFYRIQKLIPATGSCSFGENNEIRTVFCNAKNLDADLLKFQLQKTLTPLLGNTVSKIDVRQMTSLDSSSPTVNFINTK